MTTTKIASMTTSVHVAVTGAPPVQTDSVDHEVTELALTYTGNRLAELLVLVVAAGTGEAAWLETDLDAYDTVQPWIRDEVEKYRPSRQAAAQREAYDVVARYIPEDAPCDDYECLVDAAGEISEKIQEAERAAVPSMPPKEFLGMFINIDG